MGQHYKRTRLWIAPAFQGRLLLRMAAYLLAQVIFLWHIAFLFHVLSSVITGDGAAGLGGLYVQTLAQQKSLLIALALLLPVILYDLLRFSHRIAGPLYRCRAVMQQMAAGEPVTEFTPRKGDHLREFFETFNALIRVWNAKLAAESGNRAEPGGARTASPVAVRQG
jgi:hypothetical protein